MLATQALEIQTVIVRDLGILDAPED